MKTWFKGMFSIVLILMMCINAQAQTTNSKTTVKEALEWISGKLPDIKMSKYFSGSLTTKGDTRKYSYAMEYDVATCSVTIIETYAYIEDRNSARNDYTTKTTYQFKLSDISMIELVENKPYYGTKSYKLKTYNNKNAIVKNDKILVNELNIKFNQLGDLQDNPERFINAFNDAITNCGGGKKEKY